MSLNGMDLGTEQVPLQTNGNAALLDVTPIPQDGEPAHSPFQIARVPARTPASERISDPLFGRTVPRDVRQAWRELRYNLEKAREKQGVRTIGVVSMGEGDGRSLTAANIALALTEGGRRRVALIDASFDRPRVAKLLDAQAPVGLCEVLGGKVPLEAAMFAADRAGLYALSTGDADQPDFDPLDALESFSHITDRLATVFDFVLVDTPPLSGRIDGAAIAGRLDGVVLVVRKGVTRAKDVDAAIQRLGEEKILGLVMNEG